MDNCGRSQRQVLPEARDTGVKKTQPRPLSRVNGWSLPLHVFQAVSCTMYLLLSFIAFGIFIPFLPGGGRYAAYAVVGSLFLFHLVVHLITITIDPADPNVRLKKSYSQPVPTFDRSKHAHVIQNQYCHLCEVTVFFFCSVASALSGMLCAMIILLYVSIKLFTNPSELRTDPLYKEVGTVDTWLLFLPLCTVQVKTPVLLSILMVVLPLILTSVVLLGHLLVFHFYLLAKNLSTFDYIMQARFQQNTSPTERKDLCAQIEGGLPQVGAGKKHLCAQPKRGLPKEKTGSPVSPPSSSSLPNGQKQEKLLVTSLCSVLFPEAAIHPKKRSSPVAPRASEGEQPGSESEGYTHPQ
ncbi:palmitoyltransferase ZDHHC11-like isoform 2-T4 [Thomomys bottae]